MKKTITINLGGIVFYIDEDAYDLLGRYTENIRLFFKNKVDGKEVVGDIESRLAELLSERITHPNQPITISDVEEVINQVGQPEDFYDGDDDDSTSKSTQEEAQQETQKESESKSSKTKFEDAYKYKYNKKFYRNPDDKILGGVASGLAAYFDIDVMIVRVLLLALLFVAGSSAWLYIFLWIFIPEAHTAIEKLRMQGKDITVENIGKQVSNDGDSEAGKYRSDNFINSLFRGLGCVVKGFLIFLLIVLTPVWLLIFAALLAVLLATIVGGSALIGVLGEPLASTIVHTPISMVAPLVLIIGIPVGVALYALLKLGFKLPSISSTAKWILFIVWIISFIIFGIGNAGIISNWWTVYAMI